MIIVDESDPIDEIEPAFPYRDVTLRRDGCVSESYEILDEIGRGKFGRVYRCRDKETGLTLAAKIVSTKKKEEKQNVAREIEIMKILQHPRCIQLFDAIEDVNRTETCLVLEMVGGGELFDRVIQDDFVLSERACAVFIRQICEALEYIHSKSIIHLDMKPENVMCLSKNGNRIKIIDFGLARFYDPKKKLQVLFGTPDFVSPECVSFEEITLASDLWSVGVITYVLLSGLSPFMGDNDVQTMTNVTIGKYDFDDDAFDNISDDAKDFISKLLVKNKRSRLMASQCLKHPWLLPSVSSSSPPSPQPSSETPSVSVTVTPVDINSNAKIEKTNANNTKNLESTSSVRKSSKPDIAVKHGSDDDDKIKDQIKTKTDIVRQENNHSSCSSSSGISSSSFNSCHSSSTSPVPKPPPTIVQPKGTKPKIATKPTIPAKPKKDCTIRKESLDLTKEQLKQFVSNWTDNPYLFDSSREIISHVCPSSSSSSSTSSSPPPHHFDTLRRHSHNVTIAPSIIGNKDGGGLNSTRTTKSQIQTHNIILNTTKTNNSGTNSISSNNNSGINAVNKNSSISKRTNKSQPNTFECGVNIVSQIRRFSYLNDELNIMKKTTSTTNKPSNTTIRKYPVNVK